MATGGGAERACSKPMNLEWTFRSCWLECNEDAINCTDAAVGFESYVDSGDRVDTSLIRWTGIIQVEF